MLKNPWVTLWRPNLIIFTQIFPTEAQKCWSSDELKLLLKLVSQFVSKTAGGDDVTVCKEWSWLSLQPWCYSAVSLCFLFSTSSSPFSELLNFMITGRDVWKREKERPNTRRTDRKEKIHYSLFILLNSPEATHSEESPALCWDLTESLWCIHCFVHLALQPLWPLLHQLLHPATILPNSSFMYHTW